MQKTDAELIAEAERWRKFSGPWTLSLVHEVRVVADELARRLKAANEKLENTTTEIAILESQLKNANTWLDKAEWKGQRPRPLSEAERQEFGSDDD